MATLMEQRPGAIVDPLALPMTRSQQAYLDIVQGLKRFNLTQSLPVLAKEYEQRGSLESSELYPFHQHIAYHSQKMMWRGIDQVCQGHAGFINKALENPSRLRLNPDLELPEYFLNEFHCRPGGHHLDAPHQGWYTDLANYVYFGGFQDKRESKYLAVKAIPEARIGRVVDLGCGMGQSTWPLAERWTEAEVHGIDLSAGLLRYAAKRAEAMGLPIFFSQQNAERTEFPDGHFDLVYCEILFHEIPDSAAENVVREAYRLAAPGGGRFVIADIQPYRTMTAFGSFWSDWQTENNGEPFWREQGQRDLPEMLRAAGFKDVSDFSAAPAGQRPHPWITTGVKA
ncbi:MAG: class I SAM-dependent methyltransferase [Chloroflexi bacterium]|nr:class I SAM-dependent methyltransferase [Chloroflexota bacterium]